MCISALCINSIPAILGQTATGKTSVGLELAKILNGEVVSVDSRKVYKGLRIGTATPSGTWDKGAYRVEGVAHHLMDFLSPDTFYTAGDFARDAEQRIGDILHRGKIPILVGGTGFYFKALQSGLPKLPKRNDDIRAQLDHRLNQEGSASLHDELKRIDPASASAISSQDKHKLIRALEVCYLTGQPFSKGKEKPRQSSRFQYTVLGLHMNQELVEKRIEIRSREMERQGMIEEAERVLKEGYSKFCPALSSFGYRDAVEVLEGKIHRSEFLPRLIQGTKAYAKRQRTWFRTQVKPLWFKTDEKTDSREIALKMKAFLDNPPG
ncbi:MAG: tRNA (adenosine(37)-N6)-dimethylallyltransferase MiaA [Elusimicrobia bacterium]|nr:tRNA (adenosine(37)-N6)-dimethylallyltransferase MiaA [Candidatus Obscuribacterium magneticum]